QDRGHTQEPEPPGLVERRSHEEIERRARLVPHPAVIAGHHAEGIAARRKIVVERLPACARLLPVLVPAFQLVAKTDFLLRHQAERCVVDLQIAYQRRQRQTPAGVRDDVVALVVGDNLFDVYWRWNFVEGKMMRIDHAHAIRWYKPHSSIRGPRN